MLLEVKGELHIFLFHAFLVAQYKGVRDSPFLCQLMWNVLVFSSKKLVPMAPIVAIGGDRRYWQAL